MAHKKAGGSTRNGRDSAGKRLGVKVYAGTTVPAGSIIIRQRGTKYRAGANIIVGRDHTLLSTVTGTVGFSEKRVKKFDGRVFRTTFVNIEPVKA